MATLEDLETWLLAGLREELLRRNPDLYAPGAGLNDLPAESPEPWCSALASVFSIRLGVVDLRFLAESAKDADTMAFFFWMNYAPLALTTCYERMQDLVKRLSRGGRPLLPKEAAKVALDDLESRLESPQIESLRAVAAHGPQVRLGQGGWIDT